MKIATHNSEKLLLADLREARISTPSHRVLLLRLSNVAESMDVWLPHLEKSIRYTLNDAITHMYLTHDRDVFIMGWGITNKLVQDLICSLAEKLSPDSLRNLTRLFEIGVHYSELESICTAKIRRMEDIEAKEKAGKQNNKKDEPLLSADETFAAIDANYIQTISKRRQTRKDVEILIVEDDGFSQMLIKKALSDYTASVVADGRGAILNYIKKAPDIMFLDIELPDINGHEVLQKIKQIDPQAYVVMFSGNGDRENIIKAIDFGAQGFVGKPFAKEKLLQYIEKSPFVTAKRQANFTPKNPTEKEA